MKLPSAKLGVLILMYIKLFTASADDKGDHCGLRGGAHKDNYGDDACSQIQKRLLSQGIGMRSSASTAASVEAVLEASKGAIDNSIFLYQKPDLSWGLSSVYRYNGFLDGLRVMYETGIANKYFYLGPDTSNGHQYGLVNIAAFLAQSMKETIRYNACDENSWDDYRGKYPLSNACGQLGQSYQDYHCSPAEAHMECPINPNMQLTATTNAKWYGAPGPLKCGPKSVYPFTGYWDNNYECNKPWANPPETCSVYEGQDAGGENNDAPFANRNGRTDVEGCCWWGRGVIQTTGVCNFGKLNYYLGKRAADDGRASRYPNIDFCANPGVICSSEEFKELKWIAGMFYWVESLQSYNSGGWDYTTKLHEFVDGGMTDTGFIDAVSGIVNRGCHNPPCAAGDVDGKEDRRANFQKVLDAFGLPGNGVPTTPNPPTPTPPTNPNPPTPSTPCGGGNKGNGICADTTLCCSEYGWCGSSPEHCKGNNPTPVSPTTPTMPTAPTPRAPNPPTGQSKTIIGYYASWQWYDRQKLAAPPNMDFRKVQRVNFAFFQTDVNGNIWGTDSWADPQVLFGPTNWNPSAGDKTYCSWDGPTTKNCNPHQYDQGLISRAHDAGAEIYPSFGGWTKSDSFSAMAASASARTNFANKCVELIKDYDFDGIDIDWEYPGYSEHSGTPQDKENFSLLLEEVRSKLDAHSLTAGKQYGLTAALPCGPKHISNIDVPRVARVLSELNLMTYDFHGAWDATTGVNAPLYEQGWGEADFSVHDCVNNWIAAGGSQSAINIGLPFYGRSFTQATGLNQPHGGVDTANWQTDEGVPQYYNIVSKLPSMTNIRDEKTKTQYAYFNAGGGGLVSYDNEQAICDKAAYVIENDLNGFIIWELSGDLMSDLSTPLLDVVNTKLTSPNFRCGSPSPPTPPAPPTNPNPPTPPTNPNPPTPPTNPNPPTPPTPCGGGNTGNGVCADPTLCCSKYGWCGSSPDHCEDNYPTPTPPTTPATPPPTTPATPPPTTPATPSPPTGGIQCPPTGHSMIPSSDCKGFYYCANGIPSAMVPCPSGTLFNANLSVCDWASNVNC